MEFHNQQVVKHCRVCGKRLSKSKGRPAPSYSCSDHSPQLNLCFDIDVCNDIDTIDPFRICNLCYAVIGRSTKASKYGIPNKHSTKLFQWDKHNDNCLVREIAVANALIMDFSNVIIIGMPAL